MKRDMEVIRAVLKHVQDREDVNYRLVKLEGADALQTQAHVWMLWEGGMLKGRSSLYHGDQVPRIEVQDLSWEGHELAAVVVGEESWSRLRSKFSLAQLAELSLATVKDVGVALTTAFLKQAAGLQS